MKVRFLAASLATLALCAPPARAEADPPPVLAVNAAVADDLTPDPPPVSRAEFLSLEHRVKALEGKKAASTSPATVDRWTVPQYPGTVFTKAQLVSMYPGIAFNTDSAAPGVASVSSPFDGCPDRCPAAGCNTALPTTARTAGLRQSSLDPGDTLSSDPDLFPGLTYTVAGRTRSTSGITSGCAAGGCSAGGFTSGGRSGWHLGKNLGR